MYGEASTQACCGSCLYADVVAQWHAVACQLRDVDIVEQRIGLEEPAQLCSWDRSVSKDVLQSVM